MLEEKSTTCQGLICAKILPLHILPPSLRVPYTFSWCVNGHFCSVWSVNGDLFFPLLWIYIFRPRESGFQFFRDPWNMHLLTCDLWTNDLSYIISYFFGDFSVIKGGLSNTHNLIRSDKTTFRSVQFKRQLKTVFDPYTVGKLHLIKQT